MLVSNRECRCARQSVCQSVDDICHYAYVIKWCLLVVVVVLAGVDVLAELAEMRVCLFLAATKLAEPQRHRHTETRWWATDACQSQ